MGDKRKWCAVCLRCVLKFESGHVNLGTVGKKQDTC
jgi:hypothetical protein